MKIMYRGCSHAALFLATCCNGAFAAPMWSEINGPSSSPPPTSLAALADQAATNLHSTGQRVACFESTSGGLIQASLLATPGASKITTCGAISYTSSRAVPVPKLSRWMSHWTTMGTAAGQRTVPNTSQASKNE